MQEQRGRQQASGNENAEREREGENERKRANKCVRSHARTMKSYAQHIEELGSGVSSQQQVGAKLINIRARTDLGTCRSIGLQSDQTLDGPSPLPERDV